jgi:hypothetical protein
MEIVFRVKNLVFNIIGDHEFYDTPDKKND